MGDNLEHRHITHDPIYNTVDRDDFLSLIRVERYGDRTDAFDGIISATHDHFWDPTDPRLHRLLGDRSTSNGRPSCRWSSRSSSALRVADKLDERQKIRLANESSRWSLSSLLHGEQGALSLSASLCHILRDPGALEYAANQAREEARHVTGFAMLHPQPLGHAAARRRHPRRPCSTRS